MVDVARHGVSLRGLAIADNIGGKNGGEFSLATLRFHGTLQIPDHT